MCYEAGMDVLTKLLGLFDRLFLLSAASRFRSIEGLRAIAALLVFNVHFFPPYEARNYFVGSESAAPIWFLRSGLIGVDLFFVISGFLIWGSLTRRRERFLAFLSWRALRLIPAHLLTMLCIAGGAVDLGALLLNVTAMGTFVSGYTLVNNLTWSLGWEWAFYLLIYPAAAMLPRGVSWIAGLGFVVCALVTLAAQIAPAVIALPLAGRFAAFFFGMAVAELMRSERPAAQWARNVVASTPAAYVAVGSFVLLQAAWAAGLVGSDAFSRNIYFLLVAAAASVIVMGAALDKWALCTVLRNRAMRFLGQISYSFYLTHVAVGIALAQSLIWANSFPRLVACYLLSIALTTATAAVFFLLLERPYFMLRHGRRERAAAGRAAAQMLP